MYLMKKVYVMKSLSINEFNVGLFGDYTGDLKICSL